jgi:tRNA threonylcarbamoyladenosine biosynthesis protein TsaE
MKSTSLQQTEQIAKDFIQTLTPSDTATIVALHGDLGAGKTTFTQAVAKILGVTDTVTSPTFVIEKIYKLDHKDFSHLIHIDAYRLESGKELETLGWKKIAEDPKNLIFIEWPEKVSGILPENIQHIYFTHVDEGTREIKVQ